MEGRHGFRGEAVEAFLFYCAKIQFNWCSRGCGHNRAVPPVGQGSSPRKPLARRRHPSSAARAAD